MYKSPDSSCVNVHERFYCSAITGQQQRADRQRRWEEEDALGQEERRRSQRGADDSLFLQKFLLNENDVFTYYTVVFSWY